MSRALRVQTKRLESNPDALDANFEMKYSLTCTSYYEKEFYVKESLCSLVCPLSIPSSAASFQSRNNSGDASLHGLQLQAPGGSRHDSAA
jgi:hypothetical protein